ncbi:2-methylaconitate cis-trans isomerase PrpF [Basilea psittacipulmonis]|uniref:3-methylitaconate isomerase n=1 Tax=Basilea psittacipulmonis DSM 24701 TaxID=1072685 RepID=A0A077DF12_9BURK|nr:2-methylaconitate cis-trans isomerase PrpF [Basilea psittacipulmonis]AIL32022.1 3-methylitaconate isomerase [Basilea psittacipulmonis DSM 24701]
MEQINIPAAYYRGGTSKGVFFKRSDLPASAQKPGISRDQLLLRVLGSPDPYQKQMDGLGNASSSTSKAVIIDHPSVPYHDVDYLFSQVSIDKSLVDWSGNCGNLSAAVGAFAIREGFVARDRIPENGVCSVRIWQANIQKTIIAHVPIKQYQVQELGDFYLDGIAFPSAEIKLEFIEPSHAALFPTGHLIDVLDIPELGQIEATLIDASIPVVFIHAHALNLTGSETQDRINNDPIIRETLEKIRVAGALKMGIIQDASQAITQQHTPKIAWVAPPADYQTSDGKQINASDYHLQVRAMSMGKLHHAMMGTASVAIASAASIPNTIPNLNKTPSDSSEVIFAHPSGLLTVGACTTIKNGQWYIDKAIMSRSARILMQGYVFVPPFD